MEESFVEGLGIAAIIVGILIALVFIATIVWVYNDARKRGMNGTIVALLVAFIGWPISLIVYFILRPKSYSS